MASSRAFGFIPYGAIIQRFTVSSQNIVLGFIDPAEYAKSNPAYFGATIGRVANRIANASFLLNNNTQYKLAANDGPNTLHGGIIGWDKKVWTLEKSEAVESTGDREGAWVDVYSLISDDGDEEFPGKVRAEVKYLQYRQKFEGAESKLREVLEVEYEIKRIGDDDKDTVVNLTNHSYFNISPVPAPTENISTKDTVITLVTTNYLPVDNGIPNTTCTTNTYPDLEPGTPFLLGPTEPAIDHCFLLNTTPSTIPLDTRPLETKTCATAYHPISNLHLEVGTSEPAFQFYTGEHIDVEARPDGSVAKTARAAFCVEPSRYVDAINRDAWRNMVVLKKGEVYGSRIVFKGWKGVAPSTA